MINDLNLSYTYPSTSHRFRYLNKTYIKENKEFLKSNNIYKILVEINKRVVVLSVVFKEAVKWKQ